MRRTLALVAGTVAVIASGLGDNVPAVADPAPTAKLAELPVLRPSPRAEEPETAAVYVDHAGALEAYDIALAAWLDGIERARADAAARAQAEHDERVTGIIEAARKRTGRIAERWHVEMAIAAGDPRGVDPVKLIKIMLCESGGDAGARNASTASGLFQQLERYWPGRAAAAGMPGANIWDPWAQFVVAANMLTRGDSDWAPYSGGCWQ